MKCPHCAVAFSPDFTPTSLGPYPQYAGQPVEYAFRTLKAICPECDKPVVLLEHGRWFPGTRELVVLDVPNSFKRMVYPAGQMRPCPPDVPGEIKQDFEEACAVLPFSPKASAALSRRCLQHVLTDYQDAQGKNLEKQIDDFIAKKHPPQHIADELHAVRHIGNFAAHTQKDEVTGEILPVEVGEAEWNLDVLESLFDFAFIQPVKAQQRKEEFNKKLVAAGKPALI